MGQSTIPTADAPLLSYAKNLVDVGSPIAARIGATPAIFSDYAAQVVTYEAALRTATDPGTRGPAATVAKDVAKAAVLATTRQIADVATSFYGVTDPMRQSLGLNIRRAPTVAPVPTSAPTLTATVTGAVSVRVVARDPAAPSRRGKPATVSALVLHAHFGDAPPVDVDDWSTGVPTGRTTHDFYWPATAAPTAVWVCGYWLNTRNERGPASPPVRVVISGASAVPPVAVARATDEASTAMKIAA